MRVHPRRDSAPLFGLCGYVARRPAYGGDEQNEQQAIQPASQR